MIELNDGRIVIATTKQTCLYGGYATNAYDEEAEVFLADGGDIDDLESINGDLDWTIGTSQEILHQCQAVIDQDPPGPNGAFQIKRAQNIMRELGAPPWREIIQDMVNYETIHEYHSIIEQSLRSGEYRSERDREIPIEAIKRLRSLERAAKNTIDNIKEEMNRRGMNVPEMEKR